LFKETFHKYKEKKGESQENRSDQVGNQENQNMEVDGNGKGGRKKGRRTLSELIQTVGEMLVNSGRVIPLSEVFQQTSRKL